MNNSPYKLQGLSQAEVLMRQKNGQTNVPFVAKSKSIRDICRDNILTLFNILNFILAICIIVVSFGRPRLLLNMTFMGVIISNIVIGIAQEIRSKITVDRLSLLVEPEVTVMRDGREHVLKPSDLVLGDVMLLRSGNQIMVDGKILLSRGLETDESLLTGESNPVKKSAGDQVYSGSFVVAGDAAMTITKVSGDTYAAGIAREVKRTKKSNSQIVASLNRIIKFLSIVIIPLGLLLFASKIRLLNGRSDLAEIVVSTVAALIGMIPEGLVLMTSLAFAVGVINLGKHHALLQTLPAIETLARVDTLCLDKTGTITTGQMDWLEFYPIADEKIQAATTPENWVKSLTAGGKDLLLAAAIQTQIERNATAMALKKPLAALHDSCPGVTLPLPSPDLLLNFNSERKWAGAVFGDTLIYFGAPTFVLPDLAVAYPAIYRKIENLASQGLRVILVAKLTPDKQREIDPDSFDFSAAQPVAVLTLGDQLRSDAGETFSYFRAQGVTLKLISGDDPHTVAAVAGRAGVPKSDSVIDMSQVPADADLREIVEKYSIFGRVTPHRKQALLRALQANEHTVAMTGDGVNDVPALKDADCGVAMASGSDAARASADIVLLQNNLSAFVPAVNEGRRVINNIERVATLFLVKTIYSSLLAFLFIFLPFPYPIYPIQITLIASLSIGIPAFFLALRPNKRRVGGAFLRRVLYASAPAGLTCTLMVVLMITIGSVCGLSYDKTSALAAITLLTGGMIVLWQACRPWDKLKRILYAACILIFVFELIFLSDIFFIKPILSPALWPFLALLLLYPLLQKLLTRFGCVEFLLKLGHFVHNFWQRHQF